MMLVLNAFLNPWMLMGLSGILLPVIAHLISRKKYDLVEWGAMQFLELDPNAKRKFRLEELLLLLVRMGLITLVAVALARPWIGSSWLGQFAPKQPRDVVLIIDSSYSMNWDDKADGKTPHIRSQQLAREFLGDLLPGDAIQIIDAREQPQVLLSDLTRDPFRVRDALNDLPPPTGFSDLAAALRKGIQLLASGTNLQREIVVFTDMQASCWKADDEGLWSRIDDVRSQSPIAPRIWVIDSSAGQLGHAPNFALERPKLSREIAIAGVPVKISSKVKSFSNEASTRKVYLEIDQLRLDDQTVQFKISAEGETTVDFEYRFETPGSHLISLVLDNDVLPGDNRAEAVVTVTDSIPALLIDGDRKLDPTKCETFFARAALLTAGEDHPWIRPTIVVPEELTMDRLKSVKIVVVANVATLDGPSVETLQKFVASGHGVLFTLGDKVDREHYRTLLYGAGKGILPCQLDLPATDDGNEKRGVRISTQSLELPWLQPFRADRGGTLGEARWSRWWKVTPAPTLQASEEQVSLKEGLKQIDLAKGSEATDLPPEWGTAIVEARLTTGDPLIVSRRLGRGTTAIFTSSIDADWNTLPAKQDYVPFLHELLFSLATPAASRNLEINSPLILTMPSDAKIDDYQFLNPANKPLPGEEIRNAFETMARLPNTRLPGVYRFVRKSPKPNDANRPEYFVVNFDRSESDVTPLTPEQRESLSRDERLKFVENLPDLRKNLFTETSRSEIWWLLLYIFLGSLAIEGWMTRRMVQGGYGSQDASVPA